MEEINESDRMRSIKKVSMEEANGFLNMKKKQAKTIANAVFMCIISPVVLILLAGLAENGVFSLTENVAAGIGLVFLLGMIAVIPLIIAALMETLSGIYWCIITAIYLGWSFFTKQWDITWIVWPVAGLLYAAIHGVAKLVIGES